MEWKETTWDGYRKVEFSLAGRESFIIRPENPLRGNPWVWRTEFFGAFDYADRALLNMGWHVAYHRVSNMYGCPKSLQWMNEFQQVAEKKFKMAAKAVLFGFSRGGLYAVNYAAAFPNKVSLLYLDAPVLNIRSWPGGKGVGLGAPDCWEECLRCYGLTEESAAYFRDNPLDKVKKLISAKLPVLIVAGADDRTVPYVENGELFEERYRAFGGDIETIVKPHCDHHPHSLSDPTPIVEFIRKRIPF